MKATFKPTIENLEDRMMPTTMTQPLYDNDAPARAPETSDVAISSFAGQSVRILSEAPATAPTVKGGNVEFEWKVEEGESAPPIDPFLRAVPNGAPDAADYSAIVFVGGWGASMYQYAHGDIHANDVFDSPLDNGHGTHVAGTIGGTFAEHEVGHWMGMWPTSDAADKDIQMKGQKILQNAPSSEEGLCHGVTVLAYARVDGVSPASVPTTAADDVWVDGKIITGQNFNHAATDAHGTGGGGGAGKVSYSDLSVML